jgi:5-methylcytosine-specific restriction protein A
MYHDQRWLSLRAAQLAKDPLCCECMTDQRLTQATVVDHIKPHNGDPELFYDPDNLRSLCKRHHDQKTAREDGGFGNPKRVQGEG